MGVPTYHIVLTKQERELLGKISRKHSEKQITVVRAKIILRADEGHQHKKIAAQLGISERIVTKWIKRWLARVSDPVEERLQDLARSGAPDTISPEQWCQIIAMACESPSEYGLSITDWTQRELAIEAIKQGIVETISPSHLGRALKKKRSNRTE